MPLTVVFSRLAPQPWFDTFVKIRMFCSSGCKEQPIFTSLEFSTTEDAFSESLKQGSSDLLTGGIVSLFYKYH